ncbi:T9SS type A sorting domain-containing protein [Wenyingzhuangia sp. IMCC45574]
MKKNCSLVIIIFCLFSFSTFSQTLLVSQGFDESDVNEWSYVPFPTFYENQTGSDDDWYITSSMPNITATDGSFVGGGDTDNSTNPSGFSTLTFDAINIGGEEVKVSFDYHLYNYDFGDTVTLEISYDNGSDWSSPDQTVSILTNAQNFPGSSGWVTSSTIVPAGNTYVRVRFALQQNGADEIGVDNFKIETTSTLGIQSIEKSGVNVKLQTEQGYFKVSGLTKSQGFSIYNFMGQEVKKGIIHNNKEIDIQNLSSGIYVLKLENGIKFKLMKE